MRDAHLPMEFRFDIMPNAAGPSEDLSRAASTCRYLRISERSGMLDGVSPPSSIRRFSGTTAKGCWRNGTMPVYEYLCDDCGPFTQMRPMSECDEPHDCPQCSVEAPRVILTAPAFRLHARGATQSPRHQRAQFPRPQDARSIQGRGTHRDVAAVRGNRRVWSRRPKAARRGFPTARPWMISH